MYSCTEAFFYLIEYLKNEFLNLYLYLIRLVIHHFDEMNIFPGHQGPTGTRFLLNLYSVFFVAILSARVPGLGQITW